MDGVQASILASGMRPALIYSRVWEKKEKFLLYEDTYRQWVMFIVKEGSFHYKVGETDGTAGYGDIVVCPPNVPFRRVVVTPLTFLIVRFEWVDAAGETLPAAALPPLPEGKLTIRATQRLYSSCMLLQQAMAAGDPWHIHMRSHYLRDIWLLYFSEAGPGMRRDQALALSEQDRPLADPHMQQALSLIEQNALRHIHLKELACALGLSPALLTKKFKKAFGVTPIQHMTSIRLEKAKSLLLETKMTLEQISECCGYPNGFYLNRVFTKHTGETPSKYRATHRL